ncbi:hypothetical protein DET47_1048 [Shewanella putrefaciens]|nr:hypothetical protein DET47_1048 [Shewanella putrefaciens]
MGLHGIYTFYDEADPLSAVGCVSLSINSKNINILNANFQLNAMWASQEGNLWVVDDQGDVFTTAEVNFSVPAFKHLKHTNGTSNVNWHVTEAYKGQLNGIWGTTDNNVWVTSFNGPALHWDGKDWTEYALPQAPTGIDGSASDDVYIVGYHGNIHHFDGTEWHKLALPEHIRSDEAFTDVKVLSAERVYITGRSGCLLVGNAHAGFKDIGHAQYTWYGVGELAGRIFLAGGTQGIFELVDGQFVCLKDKGHPVGVFETPNAINFIPAEQQPNPWFVRYEPGASREWAKVSS